MRQTFYRIENSNFGRRMRIAVISDLHAGRADKIIELLKKTAPDYILLAGDILEALDGSKDRINEDAFCIFKACADIAPTFYCTGNHEDAGVHSGSRKWKTGEGMERIYTKGNIERIRSSGVYLLINDFVLKDGIAFGGLASGLICKDGIPDISFLNSFSSVKAPKILICHHPEYYERYIKALDVNLIVSGHAHGGPWRAFGRGLYAPGQGIFPKYTSGVHDGRLVISKGLKRGLIPRFFNPKEIVIIDT